MDSSKKEILTGTYKVLDTTIVLVQLVFACAFIFLGHYVVRSAIAGVSLHNAESLAQMATLLVIAFFLIAPMVWRLKSVAYGVVIDFDNNTLEFPGGGVAANSLADYINPLFLLQIFGRKKIDMGQIARMHQSFHRGKGFHYPVRLNISGSFGAASISFQSEGKCDELESIIRQINSMGSPYFQVK